MKTIYLFRHGEVEDAFRDRVRGGATDCLLSPAGEQMSVVNAQFLVRAGIEKIITSGMKRTDYVGEFLARQHGIGHAIDGRLKEMDMGKWEGQLLADVNAAHPAEAQQFVMNPLSGAFPGLEDAAKYRQRVWAAWEEILQAKEERLGVVSHGITNTVILHAVVGPCPLKQTIGCMNEIIVEPPATLVQSNVVLYDLQSFQARADKR